MDTFNTKKLIKPQRLKKGDRIAALSLSSGMAGDNAIRWRYNQGKQQLAEWGFEVVEPDLTLAGSSAVYQDPKARAACLHEALLDEEIAGIIAVIGGEDSYRLFEFVDIDLIRAHPKVFVGYSDSTSIHQMFRMAGVVSFYGPCLLVDMAENGGIFDFTKNSFENVLMKYNMTYTFPWRKEWTSQFVSWDEANKKIYRKMQPDEGGITLQGSGIVEGRLIGGCFEVLSMLRGTSLFPTKEDFRKALLLLETSEMRPDPIQLEIDLRTLGIMGVLQEVNGLLFGKPQDNMHFEAYQTSICKVLHEFHLDNLPVLYNCNFGHTEPKWTIPLGVIAQLDADKRTLTLLETGTL